MANPNQPQENERQNQKQPNPNDKQKVDDRKDREDAARNAQRSK